MANNDDLLGPPPASGASAWYGAEGHNVGAWPGANPGNAAWWENEPPRDRYPDEASWQEARRQWMERRHNAKGWVQDVGRYQNQAQQMAGREAHQANYRDYNRASAAGIDALGMLQSAARGQAPSQAEILAGRMNDESIAAAHSMAASARGGPMAQAAAMQAAQNRAGQMRQSGTRDIAALRAQEMAGARGAYMQGSLGYGQMGLGKSAQELQNEQFQRGLNQQGQMGFEQMAFDTKRAEQSGRLAEMGAAQESARFQQEIGERRKDRDQMMYGQMTNLAGNLGGSMISKSDDSTKNRLSYGAPTRGGAPPAAKAAPGKGPWFEDPQDQKDPWLEAQLDLRQKNSAEALSDRNFLSDYMGAARIQRDNPYGDGRPQHRIDIVRDDPYLAENQVSVSDDQAKLRAAYEKGKADQAAGPRSILQRVADGATEAGNRTVGRAADAALDNKWVGGGADAILDALPGKGPAIKPAPAVEERTEPSKPVEKGNVGVAPARVGLRAHDIARKAAPKRGPVTAIEKDANRKMAAFPYTYKPEHLPPEQADGELNYGPSANTLETNPLTATAVKRDPQGIRVLDMHKLQKAQAGSIASLQKQIDELERGGLRYGRIG